MTGPQATPQDEATITSRFWGTRGGIAVSGHSTVRHGGDTACIELRCGPHLLILDAGTGLRALGMVLAATGEPVTADLLLSHTHLDHIMGLGFFAPLYSPTTTIRLHAGHLPADDLRRAVHAVLTAPLAPDLLGAARALLDIKAFTAGQDLALQPGLTVQTAPLYHPGGSTGYRISWNGRSVVYVTDTEHDPGRADPHVLGLIRGASLMIYDTNYTDEEFSSLRGRGHSTWQEAVRLADAAQVAKLVLFHHDSGRNDDDLDRIAAAATALRPDTVVAFDGLVLTV
jgi:phosphoribosyl 1,2-cyclic phosphodiesterase